METTWCDIWKNGSTKKNSFDNTKGVTCDFFEWRKLYPLEPVEDNDEDLVEGVDYTIWLSPEINR